MNGKTKLNYIIDWLLFLAMLVIIVTGIVLWGWKKPAGMNGPGGPGAPNKAVMEKRNPPDGSVSGNHGVKQDIHGKQDNQGNQPESASNPKVTSENDRKGSSENSVTKDQRSSLKQDEKNGANKDNQPKILWGLFHGQTFWGMTKNGGWKEIHCWVSVLILIPFFIFHLLMHLKWIGRTTASFFGKRSSEASSANPPVSETPNNKLQ